MEMRFRMKLPESFGYCLRNKPPIKQEEKKRFWGFWSRRSCYLSSNFLHLNYKGRPPENTPAWKIGQTPKAREALGRGATRPIRFASVAVAAAITFRRAAVVPAASPPHAYANNWSAKAIGRKTIRTGRMRCLCHMPRRFKSNFREGSN
ncbi:hypothetical protein F0562_021087 [Nyssa sinensis]|uniref:Uncharacterized protein n=1 Tax=Nyssa sinensis TaxID=561372 RepID=A0A5J5BL77_9ASTE|nr:hypothetical protein F0562_021087 [Nyssa sinensis]